MAVHHAATTLTAQGPPAGLKALWSLAVEVLDAHISEAGLCAVREGVWPCELALLADHTYNLEAR